MDHVLGHHVILVASAAAIWVMSLITGWPASPAPPREGAAAAALVVAPPREVARSHSYAPSVAVPRDRESLIREIQRQLKRLSCYSGNVDGRWTPQVRAAAKGFADEVNAKLPLDQPDYILLRLAESQDRQVCGAAGSKAPLPSPSLLREGRLPAGDARLH